jgi:cytochrome c-type biogenesis protein CcmE
MTTASTESAPALKPVEPRRRVANPKGRFVIVCALLAAAVALVLYKGLLSSLNYFDTVDQALDHRAQIGTSSIRLEGVVVPGTVHTTPTGASFTLSGSDGRTVQVVNVGSPPDLFQADIPVVVIGSFTTASSHLFDSNQILVKHSASYIAQNPGRVKAPNGSTR